MLKIKSFMAACTMAMLLGGAIAAAQSAATETFATPNQGFDALVAAVRAHDTKSLKSILGPEGNTIIASGDPVEDQKVGQIFLEAYDTHSRLLQTDGTHATLEVGPDEWPMPIPMVKGKSGWFFDAASGKQELLARRIGRNEIYTVEACLAYVDAQQEYASGDHGDGVDNYAQRFISTAKKHDGLYWPASTGGEESPLGPAFAEANAGGYALGKTQSAQPYHGYHYRILTAQGPAASGGAYSYLANGRMIGGFALVAYPAAYGVSGVMSFVVNQDGVVFQKNLGPETARTAQGMTAFNPGAGWVKTASVDLEGE